MITSAPKDLYLLSLARNRRPWDNTMVHKEQRRRCGPTHTWYTTPPPPNQNLSIDISNLFIYSSCAGQVPTSKLSPKTMEDVPGHSAAVFTRTPFIPPAVVCACMTDELF